jgi:hypothetical protein
MLPAQLLAASKTLRQTTNCRPSRLLTNLLLRHLTKIPVLQSRWKPQRSRAVLVVLELQGRVAGSLARLLR